MQVAEQAYPLLQRLPPTNRLREHRNNRAHEEVDRWTRAGWMSFKRYKRELFDRSKASLLPLKGRIMRPEVVEALLYGCATWNLPKGHYTKLGTTHHRMLLRILRAWCKSPNKRTLSYIDALQRIKYESIKKPSAQGDCVAVGGAAPQG